MAYEQFADGSGIFDIMAKEGCHGPPSLINKINIKTAKTLHINQGKGGASSLTMEYWCRLIAQWLFIFNVRKCKN